jgi:hypothetical protein
MANTVYVIPGQPCSHVSLPLFADTPKYIVADVDATKPTVFPKGSMCIAIDSGITYQALAANVWTALSGGGGGGIDTAESLLLKSFFTHNSLLPATVTHEETNDFPVADFSNIGGGAFVRSMSRGRLAPAGAGPLNIGWDMGAAKNTVLLTTMMRVGTVSGNGLFICSTLPSTGEIPDGSFLLFVDGNGAQYQLYKRASGTFTALATEAGIGPPIGPQGASIEVGMYYDNSTHRLIAFVRQGPEQWFPIMDITDSSFTTMRYAGVRFNWNSGTPIQWLGCPMMLRCA